MIRFLLLVVIGGTMLSGCNALTRPSVLPTDREIVREQLIVHSDFHMPKNHRLLDELIARRGDISSQLEIPTSDEPIHVYLFSEEDDFHGYMKKQHPDFPNRRAFFLKNDTTLMVFAHWGDRVAEDLRHEVTHGYLHSVIPNIPLWLDEGIAEYFESPRGFAGVNRPHIKLLANAYRESRWYPSLARLESLQMANELTQLDYAESWLWVHYLLSTDAQTNSILCDALAELRRSGKSQLLAPQIESYLPDWEQRLIMHLKSLADRN